MWLHLLNLLLQNLLLLCGVCSTHKGWLENIAAIFHLNKLTQHLALNLGCLREEDLLRHGLDGQLGQNLLAVSTHDWHLGAGQRKLADSQMIS